MRHVEAYITYTVNSLSRKNLKALTSELQEIVKQHGPEAHRHYIKVLFKYVNIADNKGNKDLLHQTSLLSQEITSMISCGHLATTLCSVLESPEHHAKGKFPGFYLPQLARVLKLTSAEEVAVGLALATSTREDIVVSAQALCESKLEEVLTKVDAKLPTGLLQQLIGLVKSGDAAQIYGVSKSTCESYCSRLTDALKAQPTLDEKAMVLLPLLNDDPDDPVVATAFSASAGNAADHRVPLPGSDLSDLAAIMMDCGYGCTATASAINDVISQVPKSSINAATVARVIGMMSKTNTGLDDGVPLQVGLTDSLPYDKTSGGAGSTSQSQGSTSNAVPPPTNWDVLAFVDAIKVTSPDINWRTVIEDLDYPQFELPANPSTALDGLRLIISAYRRGTKAPFPIDLLHKPWQNGLGQLSFLRVVADPANANVPEIAQLISLPTRRLSKEGLKNTTNSNDSMMLLWSSLDFVRVIVQLADRGHYQQIRPVMQPVFDTQPDVLVLALASTPGPWGPIQRDVVNLVLPKFLEPGSSNSSFVLAKVFQSKPAVVQTTILTWHLADPSPTRMIRILDIVQDIKALMLMLQASDVNFVINLACVASQRGFINLEKWFQVQVTEKAESFIPAAAALVGKILDGRNVLAGAPSTQLQNSALAMLRILMSATDVVAGNKNLLDSISALGEKHLGKQDEVSATTAAQQPGVSENQGTNLMNVIQQATGFAQQQQAQTKGQTAVTDADKPVLADANPKDVSERVFSKQIDDEANSYFAQIYNARMSIEQVVELLKKFQNSSVQKDQDVFACMLRNLFDEYRFFPQYPEQELGITGVLFGCLIQHDLVTGKNLKKALHYVLEALRKEHASKMHRFGLHALKQFSLRLKEWPQYCQMILQLHHFDTFPPDLAGICVSGSKEAPGKGKEVTQESLQDAGKKTASGSTPTFGASNATALLSAADTSDIIEPSRQMQDKIHFVFNNLSAGNLPQKANELKQAVSSEYYPWMAQYLVLKRCSLEPNFHELYSKYLQELQLRDFNGRVLRETLSAVTGLLKSKKIGDSANSSERKLLKNLGSWLGLQTLALNKPILHRDLGLKELILYAYEQGTKNLLYIVPFVAKVLETCKQSRVFRPPNPWTMAMLSVLKELHQLPKLRLNLKFEVELLCKHLEIDIDSLVPSMLLMDIVPLEDDASNAQGHGGSPQINVTDLTKGGRSDGGDGGSATATPVYDLIPGKISSMGRYVVISPSSALFQQQPTLKPLVQNALERAVDEIINPVVDRSVKIAVISCQKLITKDFALEPDENKLRSAAHHMAQRLAGSLAMVTAKDPVRMSIGSHLRTLLVGSLQPDQKTSAPILQLIDQAIGLVCSDNLDLACAFIKRTAMDRAIPEIDEVLQESYNDRRHFRTMRSPGQPFHDSKNYGPGVSSLPTPLRPKFGGLEPTQFTLYKSFIEGSLGSMSSKQGTSPNASPIMVSSGSTLATQPSPKVSGNSPAIETSSGVPLHDKMLKNLEQILLAPSETLPPLSANHQVQGIVRELLGYVAQSASRSDLLTYLVQRLLMRLLETDHSSSVQLHEVYIQILGQLQQSYQTVAAEMTKSYRIFQGDTKLNSEIVALLLRSGLLESSPIDEYLANIIAHDGGRDFRIVAFAEEVLRLLFLSNNKPDNLAIGDFIHTTKRLSQVAPHINPPRESLVALLAQLRSAAPVQPGPNGTSDSGRPPLPPDTENDPPGLREQVRYLFEEWLRLSNQRDQEKAGVMFVTRLMHPQIAMLRTDDISTRFFRLCADQAISMSFTESEQGGAIRYRGVDAFAKLIVVLLTHFGESTKVALLNKVLKTIISILIRDFERLGARFNQKPYFRLLCNLLFDVHASDEQISFQVLTGFTHAFHVLRPSVVPAFSFAWLELISHRTFMPKLLMMKDTKGWQMLQRLLVDLFSYISPFLEVGKMNDAIRLLYKGTLRMLLVLLHDFPEFLAGYHFSLCDVIPSRCIQMRNLILSAFPRNMRLPDPFTPNLKIDLLPEIAQNPRSLSPHAAALQASPLRQEVDSYFSNQDPEFLVNLVQKFQMPLDKNVPDTQTDVKYDVPLLNSFVLYVGIKGIEDFKANPEGSMTKGPSANIFRTVASNMEPEGRYLFLNAIANQLRYPNSHTHYFSCILLFLFAEADKELTREQITRVLLERLIVNRPHPWGLLITFVELIQNRTYDFWKHDFVRCAPEIERLFESVARSCMTASRVAGRDVSGVSQ